MCRNGRSVNTGNEDDLGKDKRYDRSNQGYGFKGFHENPGSKSFKVQNSNNFRNSKQVEMENFQKVRDNVVSQERANNYEI